MLISSALFQALSIIQHGFYRFNLHRHTLAMSTIAPGSMRSWDVGQ